MKRKIAAFAMTLFFFGWLWSGWQYLKDHVPFKVWDDNMVSAIAEG